ncbi:PBSX family phage terminase large subunit [Candidatus Proelusimicrobium volucris]|uniref:PBSX family phage terminase large subunit n=1 Tax=Candidatus Proelusimicrobium volucris TaxID=3416225 RepID=UPI003D123756
MKTTNRFKVGRIFRENYTAREQTVVNIGGARSGKSYAMAQLLIMRALNRACLIAITRKTMPALKMTAFRLIMELLGKYGLFESGKLNKTENFYLLGNSRIQFFSLDDPEKIKSSEFNYIWMEEATEFTYQDYLILLTRLSAAKEADMINQIFLTLNPTDANSWIAKKLINRKGIKVIRSSYRDNPFLSKEYVDTLLSLKDYDKNAYEVYALGNWGKSDKIIYSRWRSVEEPFSNPQEIIWGLDFGFNNPSALVKVGIKDGAFCAEEKLYRAALTNDALIEELKNIIPPEERGQTIYADAAEPARIEAIYRAGFNIKAADKNILNGIMAVKSCGELLITKSSCNLIREIESYSWKTDLNGNILEEPLKFNDHALDALRYAIYSYKKEIQNSPEPSLTFF